MKKKPQYTVAEPLHIDAWGGLKISGTYLGIKEEKIGRIKKLRFLLLGGTYFNGIICPFAEVRMDYIKRIRPFREILSEKTPSNLTITRDLIGMIVGEALRNGMVDGTIFEILNSLRPLLEAQGLEDVDFCIEQFSETYPKRAYQDLKCLKSVNVGTMSGAEKALRFYRMFLLRERLIATWYLIGYNAILLDSSTPPMNMLVQGNTRLRSYSITSRLFQAIHIPRLEYTTAFFVRPFTTEKEINEVVLGFQTLLKRFLGFQDDAIPMMAKLVSKYSRLGILVDQMPQRKSSLIEKAKRLGVALQIIPIPPPEEIAAC